MNLGQAIKLCRQSRKLTQAQLAELAGISVSHLCLMEKDKREPTISKLELVAKSLNIPVSILIFLAAQYEEIKEFDETQIDKLSDAISGILEVAHRQETLF
jgi:transcriptional regulator with XRE-family HTH domain